jgi:hypothetical protein
LCPIILCRHGESHAGSPVQLAVTIQIDLEFVVPANISIQNQNGSYRGSDVVADLMLPSFQDQARG